MKKILAIDDTQFFLRMLTQVLGKKYSLKTCSDPLQGLVEMVTHKPDLILLDVEMPRINGLQILEGMQKKNLKIPTIVITGDKYSDNEQKAKDLGAEMIIYKPFKREFLLESIDNILGFQP